MEGMTIKQMNRARFLALLEEYKKALKPDGDKKSLIRLSVEIHAAKAGVPKSWGSLVDKAYRGEL